MNDYKEICETLRLANSWQFAPGYVEAMLKAADVIEQLARDNNVLTKERDAAVDDLEFGRCCTTCLNYKNKNCPPNKCLTADNDKWQWRGVKEIDDGSVI